VVAHAAQAAARAAHDTAVSAWQVLNSAWAHFVDVAELELTTTMGVEPTEFGERSRTLKSSWASIFYRPKDPDDKRQVVAGWKWMVQSFQEFVLTVQGPHDMGTPTCIQLQVSLQDSCPGEGLSRRLDASLRAMRLLARRWHNQSGFHRQEWLELERQFLEDVREDY